MEFRISDLKIVLWVVTWYHKLRSNAACCGLQDSGMNLESGLLLLA